MAKRKRGFYRPITVKVVDRTTGESFSVTVYGSRLPNVAEYVVRRLRARWTTTSLSDRRHQRRF